MTNTKHVKHYYGDQVRQLFVIGALLLVIGLPLAANSIPELLFPSIIAIMAIGLAAGLTSPFLWSAMLNLAVSLLSVMFFEYYAVSAYLNPRVFQRSPSFFWISQALAIVFTIALYFATKTLRGTARQKEVPLGDVGWED